MSRGQRIGLAVAVVVVAIVAFVIANPGSSKKSKTASGPQTFRIALKGHSPVGGRKTITITQGNRAVILVSSDGKDTVHLHGWNIEREITPSKPGRFAFKADNQGAYELESHTTNQKIATIQVRPG